MIGIASALLVVPFLDAQPGAQSAYVETLERYRAGDDSAAVTLASVDEKGVQPVQDALLAVALVAHTDAAVALLDVADFARSRQHLARAQTYAERIQSKNRADPLARRWWTFAIGYMHAQRNYVGVVRVIERARVLSGDTPELLLASGITNEFIASGRQGRESGGPKLGSFQQAENLYKSALAADPSLLEARLRLARVLTLRGDNASAAQMLSQFQAPDDPLFTYLARLFEGDALERLGATDEAKRRYEAAIALFPRAQSAQIALAYSLRSAGGYSEAAERLQTTAAADIADAADPWFWYSSGFASRIEATLVELKKTVRQ
jgi:tetratricopeptide (TPR) repeat protein